MTANFYPRPPRGGRLAAPVAAPSAENISIHALREEGDIIEFVIRSSEKISIHALREEGDLLLLADFAALEISIHALREEGDNSSNSLIFY